MLNRAGGGYTYNLVSRDDSGDVLEDKNEMLAHVKKYIIGKGADCDGNMGINGDAANNIYLMRLADVYLTYVEAKMGTATSTSDATAMKYYNMVRQRAGVTEEQSVTYEELLRERRRELAFESQTWFDTQRYRYREGDDKALELINTGYGTGYNRCAMFVNKPGVTIDPTNENDRGSYHVVQSTGRLGTVRSYQPACGVVRGADTGRGEQCLAPRFRPSLSISMPHRISISIDNKTQARYETYRSIYNIHAVAAAMAFRCSRVPKQMPRATVAPPPIKYARSCRMSAGRPR